MSLLITSLSLVEKEDIISDTERCLRGIEKCSFVVIANYQCRDSLAGGDVDEGLTQVADHGVA